MVSKPKKVKTVGVSGEKIVVSVSVADGSDGSRTLPSRSEVRNPRKPRMFLFGFSAPGFSPREKILRLKKNTVPAILKDLGCEGAVVRFSQYAGCSCGCSPGFIIDAEIDGVSDIFVSFE